MRASDSVAIECDAPEASRGGLVPEHAALESGVQTRHDSLRARLRLCGFGVPVYYDELQPSECSAGCVLFCAPARPTIFPFGSRELHVLGVPF
jgi:hypothetical protein